MKDAGGNHALESEINDKGEKEYINRSKVWKGKIHVEQYNLLGE